MCPGRVSTVLVIFFIASMTSSLKIKRLDVPKSVANGSSVDLACDFDLEGEVLYSVKWYKNFIEFYRFLPSNFPRSAETMGMKGTVVDETRSNSTNVHLAYSDLDSQGLYTCEVSTESPSYSTIRAEDIMQVYVLPSERTAVRIDGSALNTRLDSGDFINLTCVSGPSFPASTLTWFINGDQAQEDQVIQYPIQVLMNGLQRRRLGLFVQASSSLFTPAGVLRLRCSASLLLTYEFEALRVVTPAPASALPLDSHHTHHHHHGHQTAARNLHQLQRPGVHASIAGNAIDQETESFADAGAFYLTQGNSASRSRESPVIESRSTLDETSDTATSTAFMYRMGDWINLNCSTSGDLAHLRWFINDKDVSSSKRLTESADGDELELVDKGDHKAKNSPYKRSTSSAGGHSSTWKSGHSSDTSNTKWTLPLRFQLDPSHFRSGEIKLRCLANYYHIIREYNTSIDVRSYNYQAIEAQSTSAASSCKLRCLCSSNTPAFIFLIILVTQLPLIHLQITSLLSTFLTWTHSYFIKLHPLFQSPSSLQRSSSSSSSHSPATVKTPPPHLPRPPPPPTRRPQSPSPPSSWPSLPSSPFTSSSSNSFTSSLPGHLLPLKALPPLVSPMSSIMSRVNSDFHFSPAVCTSKITTKR